MKEEALKLADELDALHQYVPSEAPAVIRRLVGELNKYKMAWNMAEIELEKLKQQTKPTITKLDGKVVAITMTDDEHRVHEFLWEAPKPLSDEEIKDIKEHLPPSLSKPELLMLFAKAIEERHGIK